MFCMTADRLGVARPVSCQNPYSLLNRSYEAATKLNHHHSRLSRGTY